MIDLEIEDVIVLDESRCQNTTNTARRICNPTIDGKKDKIKFNIKDGKSCVAFIKGEPIEYSNGVEFTLERGGGALIIIEK